MYLKLTEMIVQNMLHYCIHLSLQMSCLTHEKNTVYLGEVKYVQLSQNMCID